jgi:superfamily II helicase
MGNKMKKVIILLLMMLSVNVNAKEGETLTRVISNEMGRTVHTLRLRGYDYEEHSDTLRVLFHIKFNKPGVDEYLDRLCNLIVANDETLTMKKVRIVMYNATSLYPLKQECK